MDRRYATPRSPEDVKTEWREATVSSQRARNDVQESEVMPGDAGIVEEARARVRRERELSTSTRTDCYAAASLGQLPYVSLPGVGVVVVEKRSWGC